MAAKSSEDFISKVSFISLDAFDDEEFTVNQFLSKYRHVFTLKELKPEVLEYKTQLQEKINDALLKGYKIYESIPAKLSPLVDDIDELHEKIEEIEADFEGRRARVVDYVEDVRLKTKELHALYKKRRELLRLKESYHYTSWMEKHILQLESRDGYMNTVLLSIAMHRTEDILDKEEFEFYTRAGDDSKTRAQEVRTQLLRQLDMFYAEIIALILDKGSIEGNEASLARLFIAYANLGEHMHCERFTTRNLIQSMLNTIFRDRISTPSRFSEAAGKILKYVHDIVLPLAQMAEYPVEGTKELLAVVVAPARSQRYDIIGNSFTSYFFASLTEACKPLFTSTKAEDFMKSYKVSATLIRSMATTDEFRKKIEENEEYLAYVGKWNFAIYYKMRMISITKNLGPHLAKKRPNLTQSGGKFAIETTKLVLQALQKCFSEDILIHHLIGEFVGLFCQIVLVYSDWLCGVTLDDFSGAAAEKSYLQYLVAAYSDVHALEVEIKAIPDTFFKANAGEYTQQEQRLVKSIVSEAGASLAVCGTILGEAVSDMLFRQCDKVAKEPVLGIQAQYSMTGKPFPTSPSYFIDSIFQPLSQFRDAAYQNVPRGGQRGQENQEDSFVDAMTVTKWTGEALSKIFTQYTEYAHKVIEVMVRRTETIAKLQRKRKEGANTVVTSESGLINVYEQFRLDCERLKTISWDFGVDVSELASFRKLMNAIDPKSRG